jgi:hypothetical protein
MFSLLASKAFVPKKEGINDSYKYLQNFSFFFEIIHVCSIRNVADTPAVVLLSMTSSTYCTGRVIRTFLQCLNAVWDRPHKLHEAPVMRVPSGEIR